MNKKFLTGAVAALVVGVAAVVVLGDFAWAQNAACNVLNCREQGGARWSVGGSLDVLSGGDLDIESGGSLTIAGTDITTELSILSGVTASTEDLNATTNFEETLSSSTTVITVTDGTIDFNIASHDGSNGLKLGNTLVTATATELNYTDVTTAGTAQASKVVTTDSNIDVTALRNLTTTGDLTVSTPTNGGDAGERNNIQGLFKLKLVTLGVLKNGDNTEGPYIDETPTGEWTATANVTASADATIFRAGAKSLKVIWASGVDGNGVDNPLTSGDEDWQAEESVGLWVYCDATTSSGDLVLGITDNASETEVDFPALDTANQWQWLEIDISSVGAGDRDVITDIAIDVSGATTITCYFDTMWTWDLSDEAALGVNLVQDGVLGLMDMITATGSARTYTVMTEETDYFIHYESGNDFVVMTGDESANSGIAMVAHQ